MATKKVQEYNEESIKHLSGKDAVRAKPQMYIGATDGRGVFTIVREALDNIIDEAISGHCSRGEVFIAEDGSYHVLDDGRGIPTGDMTVKDNVTSKEHKLPAIQAITSLLHTGGKMETEGGNAYSASRGTHGVGIKATNFLSKTFDVHTFYKGKWWHIGFKKGTMTSPLEQCMAPKHPFSGDKLKKGTMLSFLPDDTIFSSVKFSTAFLQEWASLASYFTPNFTFVISHHSGKSKEYASDNGPAQYVIDAMASLNAAPITASVFSFSNPLVDCVFQYSTLDGNSMRGFTNGLSNAEGGVHLDAFFASLKAAITPYAKKNQNFTVNELREGLIGLVNVKLSAPQFDSQTKEKLVDPRGKQPVQEFLDSALEDFFKANKKFAIELCDRCTQLKSLRNRFQQSRRALSEIRRITSKGLPAKAATAPGCAPEKRELILLEGESAAGCFTGDTLVRLINGESRRFDEMAELAKEGEEFYGYAYDLRNERTTVIKFDEPRLTKHVTELIEVTLSNGQVLRCTTDHPFLTRDGVYVAAENLSVGTDLMTHAEEIEEIKQGNPRRVAVSPTITQDGGGQRIYGSKVYVFRSAAFLRRKNRKALRDSMSHDPVQVHHVDGNSLNDHPSNLEALPESEHNSHHASERGKASGIGERHSRRMKDEPAYREKCVARTKVRMKEVWADTDRRSAQSVTIKQYFENPEARAKTSLATSLGMKNLWLKIAAKAADPFSEACFDQAKAALDSRTPMRSKSWAKFFMSKSQARKAIQAFRKNGVKK